MDQRERQAATKYKAGKGRELVCFLGKPMHGSLARHLMQYFPQTIRRDNRTTETDKRGKADTHKGK